MEVIPLGRTELPIELVLEYLDSLKSIYSAEVRYMERVSKIGLTT